MKIIASAFVTLALACAATPAFAGERVGDAAIGAVSGAVVLGPVGAVAGAIVGFTAGPSISRSWRRNRNLPRHHARGARRPTHVAARQRTPAAAPGVVTAAKPAPGVGGPPAQGLE
jgi:hypothetical protein